jgi:hypothetical protein
MPGEVLATTCSVAGAGMADAGIAAASLGAAASRGIDDDDTRRGASGRSPGIAVEGCIGQV